MTEQEEREATFPVVEIFGPTIQGEGPLVGMKCVFVRFAHCDSDCVWCDTKYSWDTKDPGYKFDVMTAHQIVDRVVALAGVPSSVVLSGGNPALQLHMKSILDLVPQYVSVSIETQGTLYQPWFRSCDWVVISPKLSNAQLTRPISPKFVKELVSRITSDEPMPYFQGRHTVHPTQVALKIVVFGFEDVDEAVYLYSSIVPPSNFFLQIGTHIEDTTEDILDRWRMITQYVTSHKYDSLQVRVLPQMHVLLWGHGRGF